MIIITAWFLVTISGSNGLVSYSPPFNTEAECQRIKQQIPHSLNSKFISENKCIQMTVVK
jgi:hypothetical protein